MIILFVVAVIVFCFGLGLCRAAADADDAKGTR